MPRALAATQRYCHFAALRRQPVEVEDYSVRREIEKMPYNAAPAQHGTRIHSVPELFKLACVLPGIFFVP